MKWQTYETEAAPPYGATRRVRKFAWTPVQCDDNVTVWLEHYAVVQEYVKDGGNYCPEGDGLATGYREWYDEWVTRKVEPWR